MTLRLLYSAAKGEFEKSIRELYRPIAEASTAAIRGWRGARGRRTLGAACHPATRRPALRVERGGLGGRIPDPHRTWPATPPRGPHAGLVRGVT